jgi:hypothetical protein
MVRQLENQQTVENESKKKKKKKRLESSREQERPRRVANIDNTKVFERRLFGTFAKWLMGC